MTTKIWLVFPCLNTKLTPFQSPTYRGIFRLLTGTPASPNLASRWRNTWVQWPASSNTRQCRTTKRRNSARLWPRQAWTPPSSSGTIAGATSRFWASTVQTSSLGTSSGVLTTAACSLVGTPKEWSNSTTSTTALKYPSTKTKSLIINPSTNFAGWICVTSTTSL